jgi:hypothetical protein
MCHIPSLFGSWADKIKFPGLTVEFAYISLLHTRAHLTLTTMSVQVNGFKSGQLFDQIKKAFDGMDDTAKKAQIQKVFGPLYASLRA